VRDISSPYTNTSKNDAGSRVSNLAANIIALRTERGISIAALATDAKVGKSVIYAIERGEARRTHIGNLKRIADYFNVTVSELCTPPGPGRTTRQRGAWTDIANRPEHDDEKARMLRFIAELIDLYCTSSDCRMSHVAAKRIVECGEKLAYIALEPKRDAIQLQSRTGYRRKSPLVLS